MTCEQTERASLPLRIAIAILFGLVAWSCNSCSANARVFPTQYDAMIRKAQRTFLPDIPPALLKAQAWQESNLNCNAVSPVGAAGCAQFMPATWVEVSRALGYTNVPRSAAEPAFMGMAYYMAQLRRRWNGRQDEYLFALGGYNAGNGNIGRADRANAEGTWDGLCAQLPAVTGRHAEETIGYVRRIVTVWFPLMEGKL